jgi:hypothetical protein
MCGGPVTKNNRRGYFRLLMAESWSEIVKGFK